VFSKIRERLGGNVRFMASGGAAVGQKVLEFFEDIGIPICEGYGLTETAPVITSGTVGWKTRRLGCVGVPLQDVDVRIVDPATNEDLPPNTDGEICCSGRNVMVGYHNKPEANDEVFFYKDGKRFFRTGDMGRMVDGKFLKITGRIKEQYKLENGKYVVPAPLEDMICRSLFIAQAVVYGDNKAFNVALLVPEIAEIRSWAARQKINAPDDATLMQTAEVKALLSDELVSTSAMMKSFERPLRWTHILEPFTQDNQMLTPKMSLRRNNVLKVHGALITDLYSGAAGVQLQRQPAGHHE